MKIPPEVNATRRKAIWKQLRRKYPTTHDFGFLQVFLSELGLSWEKDSMHFYIKKKCFAQPYIESIVIKIKSLEVVVNVSTNTTNLTWQEIEAGEVPSIGYIYTASNVYKPFTLTDMRRILRQNTTAVEVE